jgi:hypothetical protein
VCAGWPTTCRFRWCPCVGVVDQVAEDVFHLDTFYEGVEKAAGLTGLEYAVLLP